MDYSDGSERRFRTLMENLGESVTVVDLEGAPIWTSAAINHDLGYHQDFWADANLFTLVHPDDLPAIEAGYQRLLDTPEIVVSDEVRLRGPDGKYQHTGFVAKNLLDDPEIGGIVITARSIEAEMKVRRANERHQQKLENALAERARFIARLSHEMRSPLHAIQGLAEVLLGSSKISHPERQQVESIEREATALRHMIDDLLDMSKISAGHMELLSEPFSPAALVDEIASNHRPRAAAKSLDLRVVIGSVVPRVLIGDRHRVRQVLVNLVSNAIKYTDTGWIEIRLDTDSDGMTRFSVQDTGRGISKDKAAFLFEPYKQLRVEDTSVGTGIGLAITKMLVELMNGQVSFCSDSGGTTFIVELPLQEGRRTTDFVAVETSAKTSSVGGTVLIVDDSEVNRMLASAQLTRLGYTPIVVESGHDCLDLVKAGEHVDVILMDWHMPEMDGLETTRLIRALGDEIDQRPIIAVTASVMSGDREVCLAAGMDDYLAKPVSLDDLDHMLTKWSETEPSATTKRRPDSIDDDALERLVDDVGDASVAHSILMTFLTELSSWRDQIDAGVQTGDLETARRTAHTVKSTAAMLGAASLSDACRRFEHEAMNDGAARSLLEEVLSSANEAEEALVERAENWSSS